MTTAPEPGPVSTSASPVELGSSEEQDQLRDLVRSFLAETSSEEDVRELMQTETGRNDQVWTRMAEELGLPGLIVPEAFGGAGLSAVELGIVMEEMGRVLYCGPFLSTAVMAATALLESGDPAAQSELLPAIAAGRTRMTLAIDEASAATFDLSQISARASRAGNETRLDGIKHFVVDGATADGILVVARGEQGLGLFYVEGDAEGLERTPTPALDPTRKLARLEFSRTRARAIACDESAILRTHDRIVSALASEQVGGAQRCLDMAVDYASERVQFGRPIGSFQAIKHKCADLLVQVEAAKSAARYAATCPTSAPRELAIAASMAKAYCSGAFVHAAEENLQIHGGVGFTWEHPCHLYLKRARSSLQLFGDPLHHRERVAAAVGI